MMRGALTILLVVFYPLVATGETNTSNILEKVQAFYERTTDYKAEFHQTVRTKSPKRTFDRSGTVYFKRPGMMRWDYTKPDRVYYVCDGVELWSYDVQEGTAYRMRVDRSDLFEALRFLMGTASLAQEFFVEELPARKDGLVPLKMTPRVSQSNFQSVTLFVDPSTGETRETEVVDPMGNISHVRFENPSFVKLPAEGFKFRPPEGVRVQDLSGK